MKSLLASTAIALSFATPLFADAHSSSSFVERIDTQALRASDLLGARLYVTELSDDLSADQSDDWDDVGEISDILIGTDGGIDTVLTDIGGFLGVGERTVAVKMDDLQFVSDGEESDDYFIVLTGSAAQLESAPAFEEDFVDGRGDAVSTDMETETAETAEEPETDEEAVAAESETDDAAEIETVEMETDVETETVEVASNEEAETETEAVEMASVEEAEAEQIEETSVTGTGLDTQSTATTQTIETADTDLSDANEPIDGDVDVQEQIVEGESDGDASGMEREGYQMVLIDDMTAEDITGVTVYDANDESIGEIGELIVGDGDSIEQAIIDVGGFLGLGEKPVAVSMSEITLMEGEGELRAYVSSTEEELEAMPAYEEN